MGRAFGRANTASAPRLALSKATFPIAPEACAGPHRAPFRKFLYLPTILVCVETLANPVSRFGSWVHYEFARWGTERVVQGQPVTLRTSPKQLRRVNCAQPGALDQ